MKRFATMAMAVVMAGATPAWAAQTPAPPIASVAEDPAALAQARVIVVKLLPPGVYKTLMGSTMSSMMDNMGESLAALPLKQLAQLGGLDGKQAAALDKVDLAKVMAIYDPNWQARTRLSMRAMFVAMGDFFTTMEPELREAYARAYAHSFTVEELRDLDRYFATPTGGKFAQRYLTLATDPAIIDATKAMMPRMMAEMPRFVEAAQKATAALPPARKMQDLSAAQKTELAKALGVTPDKLRDPGATP